LLGYESLETLEDNAKLTIDGLEDTYECPGPARRPIFLLAAADRRRLWSGEAAVVIAALSAHWGLSPPS
jgi:hypothetical protein